MLDPVRARVLQNMAFNLGIDGLLGFKNTLSAVKAKNWAAASQGMLSSRWAEQVGARAQRLAKMMRTGAV
jgi:lysozyme